VNTSQPPSPFSDFQIVTSAEAVLATKAVEASTSQDNCASRRDVAFRFTGVTFPFLKLERPISRSRRAVEASFLLRGRKRQRRTATAEFVCVPSYFRRTTPLALASTSGVVFGAPKRARSLFAKAAY
jgi:hypothetical protein